MSNLIAFLETLGQDARLAGLKGEDYVAAVDALGLDDDARQALLARDAGALNALLGGRLQMMSILFPADGDEKKDDQPADDEPADDDTKESIHLRGRH